ncbi:Glucose dehydrogenase [acceptor] [Ooceraea biroi]|uniref:Glucose dehydrogenase [acceptor] n=1 Tax=Ooceraea biroi TaxID=2015173 RepID=A0A026WE34_OOCBI|nr:Glucose dehydrogenase [acceptor] [Ooceraea biroi]
MDIPLIVHLLQLNNDINWKYRTKPSNKYCLGMHDNSCNWPRGKVVGGSSVLNYMIATRGSAEDYDRWAKMGNEGWAYKDVLKYFKRLETIDIPELQSDNTYHGTTGPLHISYPVYRTLLAEGFLKAGEEMGYQTHTDYNGKDMMGFSYLQTTIKNGTRMSSNRAYLQLARNHKNLYLTIESIVKKVLIDRNANRAVGVEFMKYGQRASVFARKEVILCAGAIGSPQLLMLSGIGPAKHLADLGINVVRDAPVGENLMDHITYGGLSWSVDASIAVQMFDIINPVNPYLRDFLIRRSGPVTIPGACEALAFINAKNPKVRRGLPDIELLFVGGAIPMDTFIPITMGVNRRMLDLWQKYTGGYGWSILPMLLKPKSRGQIRLLANDVNVKPEIVPNYYDHPDDVNTMIAGIKAALSVGQTRAMREFNSRLLDDIIPGCESYEYNSDAYWECAVRTLSFTIYHYSGTCKMGPRKDPTAVVDPKLKVIGVERLRVADASIMPEIISAHTNVPVYMIAEKLVDMIKEEWGYSKSRS